MGDIRAFMATTIEELTPTVEPALTFRQWPGKKPLERASKDDGTNRWFQVRCAHNGKSGPEFGSCREMIDTVEVRVLHLLNEREAAGEDRMDSDGQDIIVGLTVAALDWPDGFGGILPTGGGVESLATNDGIKIHTVTFEVTYQQS